MATIVGIKFRTSGKVYYFDPGEFDLHYGDNVIVETARGMEYGMVMLAPREIDEENLKQPLKPVIRTAVEEDAAIEDENRQKEAEAFKICKDLIIKHELEMKLINCEYTFDRSKVLFYFTADGRIDFRELVKDLAAVFKTRIELRQVGVRDETKLLGGIGVCGRRLCCSTYLHDFMPVSIRMAKDQGLSLNQSKISGTCGRLMCCLKNEQETYEYLNSCLPKKGEKVTTPDGILADVQSVDILRQKVTVLVDVDEDEKELIDYPVSELKFKRRRKTEEHAESEGNRLAEESIKKEPVIGSEFGGYRGIQEEESETESAEEYMAMYDLSAYYGEEDKAETEVPVSNEDNIEEAHEASSEEPVSSDERVQENPEAETESDYNAESAAEKSQKRSRRNRSRRRNHAKASNENAGKNGAEEKERKNAGAVGGSGSEKPNEQVKGGRRRRRNRSENRTDGIAENRNESRAEGRAESKSESRAEGRAENSGRENKENNNAERVGKSENARRRRRRHHPKKTGDAVTKDA